MELHVLEFPIRFGCNVSVCLLEGPSLPPVRASVPSIAASILSIWMLVVFPSALGFGLFYQSRLGGSEHV